MKKNMSVNAKRQVVLDVETTGMNGDGSKRVYEGHKIIEIGAVEIVNRRLTENCFHTYVNPNRKIDEIAFAVHGISNDDLENEKLFSEIAEDFIDFIDDAELIIHNAAFDVAFIDYEFELMKHTFKIADHCLVTDTLAIAKQLFPGKRNNLDVLCERYQINNSERTLHSALLDAKLLAAVYLAMTGGQTTLSFSTDDNLASQDGSMVKRASTERGTRGLRVILADDNELACHDEVLNNIEKKSGSAIWRSVE